MIGETVLVNGSAVENVLVEPGQARDASDPALPEGTVAEYTLRFPCSYEGDLSGAKVTVRGRELDALSFADHWRPAAVFGSWSLPWDMTLVVGRALGDYTAEVRIVELSAALDALGDATIAETAVYEGPAQARMVSGGTSAGTALQSDDVEEWRFVVPWRDAFAFLRPRSTRIEHAGARLEVASIEDVGLKGETASFKAVRRG